MRRAAHTGTLRVDRPFCFLLGAGFRGTVLCAGAGQEPTAWAAGRSPANT